jgi:Ser/Thr protein kinase RdoA (MazF antagonist)
MSKALDQKEIKEFLRANYDFYPLSIQLTTPQGLSAVTYDVVVDDQLLVLKFLPFDKARDAQRGINIAKVCYGKGTLLKFHQNKKGSLVTYFNSSAAYVMNRLPGRTCNSGSHISMQDYGSLFASIHNADAKSKLYAKKNDVSLLYRRITEILPPLKLSQASAERLAKQNKRRLKFLIAVEKEGPFLKEKDCIPLPDIIGHCHGDLDVNNVVAECQNLSAIDFDMAREQCYQIVDLFKNWRHEGHEKVESVRDFFLSYAEKRKDFGLDPENELQFEAFLKCVWYLRTRLIFHIENACSEKRPGFKYGEKEIVDAEKKLAPASAYLGFPCPYLHR